MSLFQKAIPGTNFQLAHNVANLPHYLGAGLFLDQYANWRYARIGFV